MESDITPELLPLYNSKRNEFVKLLVISFISYRYESMGNSDLYKATEQTGTRYNFLSRKINFS